MICARQPALQAQRCAMALGGLRAWIFGLWFFYVATTPFPDPRPLAGFDFTPPLSIAWVLTWLWQHPAAPSLLTAMQFLLLGSLAAAVVGLRPYRLLALAALCLLVLHQGLARSFGHINHPELALMYATLAIAIAPAADAASWPRRAGLAPASLYRGAIVLVSLAVLLPYAASAAYRCAHHPWATFYSDAVLRVLEVTSFEYGYQAGISLERDSPIAHAVALLAVPATLCELAAPLALRWRLWRRLWIVYAVSFHAMIAVFMRISFWESMLLVPAVLIAVDYAQGDGSE